MPELPEVQTIVTDLDKKIIGRRIIKIWFDWPKMLKDPLDQQKNKVAHKHVALFQKIIKGKKILKVKRRAKNILIYLSKSSKLTAKSYLMLIHLKMTGHLLVGKWKVKGNKVFPLEPRAAVEDPYNQYIHVIFYLDDGRMIGYSDVRKFGKILLSYKDKIENLPELKNLGPEPLDKSFKFDHFKEILKGEGRKIKPALMDPGVIAGIGNIYSDEILWKAKIHPLKSANKLSDQELRKLWNAIHQILTKAVRLRGTSTSDYRDAAGEKGYYTNERLVYQREGEKCKRCKAKIKRMQVGGRSAHFCPKCQRLK